VAVPTLICESESIENDKPRLSLVRDGRH